MGYQGSLRRRLRTFAVAGAVAALSVTLASCATDTSDPEALADKFAAALDDSDADAAGALTSYPNAAAATLGQIFDGMHAEKVDYQVSQYIPLDDESGFFTMDAKWHFGDGKDWNYSTQASIHKLAVGWRVSWDPGAVMPGLGGDRTVNLVRTDAPAPVVRDIGGGPLMTEQVINAVKFDASRAPDPVASTNALAKVIEVVAPLITGPSLMADIAAADGGSITAVNLREADFEILEPDMAPIPGVVLEKQPKLISADRRIVSPLLDPLRNVWQANRDATAGWAVHISTPDGAPPTQTAGYQGPPGPDITSTLDVRMQLAAEEAAVSVGTPAAIVAIQPSSGALLAVAQNSQANEIGPIAFTGLFPAGENLELVRNAAAVMKGVAPKDVSPEDLAEAASTLGLGVDFAIPGLEETTGRMPNAGKGMEQVRRDANRSEEPQVSPFGMALVAASIARGSTPMPMIAMGQPATTAAPLEPIRPDVVDRLRGMMRGAAANPDYAGLRGYGDAIGFPAASGDDRWLIGQRGDMAFAVYVEDVDGSDMAVKVAARMLRAFDHPAAQ
ncbi:NTF2-like N-terminal transpeptidase domain-containing protein [Aldersonia kunmingensis]|uniref:NTF2-like N-terminal transpeptidase domain-containing protein n=1 Tax=Aldersonia kunmingensis TaxID=408066 RepID=UPI000B008687|nr:NTF2-like N-terminal transpeptidase domain-containing protein [Aldersonia kunmingensis]